MSLDLHHVVHFIQTAPRSTVLYKACRDYASHFDGENDLDSYSNGEFRVLREWIPACRVVFDVGANRGDWTELALTINPGIEVHAFEPARDSFAALVAKVPAQVRCNNVALGSVAEERELFTLGADSQLKSLYARTGLEDEHRIETPTSGERVTVTTLDDYCRGAGVEAIDFLKIDAEGHDLEVLRGARGLIERKAVRFIQFEYGAALVESRTFLKDFFAFFQNLGYDLHKIHAEGYSHYPRYNVRLDNFQYQNWLVVRRD
jgi:FkbM family methyltransferase